MKDKTAPPPANAEPSLHAVIDNELRAYSITGTTVELNSPEALAFMLQETTAALEDARTEVLVLRAKLAHALTIVARHTKPSSDSEASAKQ